MSIVISEEKKRAYINTEFHQFFNITLKSSRAYEEGFSHNIQFSKYQNKTNDSILNKYDDYGWSADETGICERVIDGDTLVLQGGRRIRLVGINTPEKGMNGYETSKKFVEKLCLNQTIGIVIDESKETDSYGRTLAVVLIENKNLNQILLKERLAEIMYIEPSMFYPYNWDANAHVSTKHETLLAKNLDHQFMNVVIPIEEICGEDYGISKFMKYFNDEFSNIVVTDTNDFSTLYKCECYQNTLFIRIDPIKVNSDLTINITIHLLPKQYNGLDSILLFKDNYAYLNTKMLQLEKTLNDRYYDIHRNYLTDEDGNFVLDNYQEKISTNIINAYFQSGLNGQNRKDRFHINDDDYPEFDKFDSNLKYYQDYDSNNEWIEENWNEPFDSDEEMYTEFQCDISRFTGNMTNLQIDACYKYNDSSPTNAIHYLGVKDTTNYDQADRCTLIDANLDNIIDNEITNYISQFEYKNNQPHFPTTLNTVQEENSYTHSHTDNIGEKHYKTIKYFNDRLFSEEKCIEDNEVIKHGYTIGDWKDLSL